MFAYASLYVKSLDLMLRSLGSLATLANVILFAIKDELANTVSLPVHSKSVSLAAIFLSPSLVITFPSSFTSLIAQVLLFSSVRRLISNVAVTLVPSKFLAAVAFGVNVTVPAPFPASIFCPYVISNRSLITTEPNLTCADASVSAISSILVVDGSSFCAITGFLRVAS